MANDNFDVVRDFIAKLGYNNLEDAIKRAIDYCIEHNILKDFLLKRRPEVEKMAFFDYTYEGQLALLEEEKQAEIAEARESGVKQAIEQMLRKGRTPVEIAEFCGYAISFVEEVEAQLLIESNK